MGLMRRLKASGMPQRICWKYAEKIKEAPIGETGGAGYPARAQGFPITDEDSALNA